MTCILQPFDLAEVIDVAEAAKRAGKAQRTLREWCALHGIGRRIAGRWAVSAVALDMLLAGDLKSLEAYVAGDRSSDRVRAYFVRRSISPPKADSSIG
jgi:hypothetical protein